MKLVKLSLAAVVAAGAMTTFASATPLEDAIKGVEVSGLARYRFYHSSDAGIGYGSTDNQRNRFSGLLNITSPVADNLKFGISLATVNNNFASDSASNAGNVAVNKFWFQYAINDLTIKAGKIEIPTPWTQAGFTGTRGNGILALYSGVENFTFAAAYYNQVDAMNGLWGNLFGPGSVDALIGEEDLMAAAVIGKVGPVDLQVWMARMEHAIDYTVFGEAGFNIEGFNLKGQINYMKVTDTLDLFADDAGIYFGFEGGYKNDMFFVNLGYTKTDDDMPLHAFDGDNDGFIKFGKQLYYKTVNNPDTQVFFGNAGINYDKFGAAVGYGYADVGALSNSDMDEFYGQLTYQVAKNFGLELYYSVLSADDDLDENDELRFQAIYNF